MIEVNLDYFFTEGNRLQDMWENFSEYCHAIDSPVHVIGETSLDLTGDELIYPNVEYVSHLWVIDPTNISVILPDLVKVGRISGLGQLLDMGNIKEVNVFKNMSKYSSDKKPELKCDPAGNHNYVFSKKGYYKMVKIHKISY
jgi:hypothetical protein